MGSNRLSEKELEIVKLGVDEYNGVVVPNFSSEDRNRAIRGKFFELFGTDRPDAMDIEEHKYKMFRIMREVIQETITNKEDVEADFFNRFVEKRVVALGDSVEFEIENDSYLSVSKISGNNWDLRRQRVDQGAVREIKTDAYGIAIYEYFKRFLAGRMDFARLLTKVADSLTKFENDFATTKFAEAITGLPSRYKYSGAYNKGSIMSVISHVVASNKGQRITLAGTKEALAKLEGVEAAKLPENAKVELYENGYFGKWNGYDCVALPTVYKANTTEFAFDNQTIYVLPSVDGKPVKLVQEGDVQVLETASNTENMDMSKDYKAIFRLGGAIIISSAMGSIKITA